MRNDRPYWDMYIAKKQFRAAFMGTVGRYVLLPTVEWLAAQIERVKP